jgi:hypothetical protein
MAYNTTAKGLSALGRHGDNTLLHVGKDELAGLQSLLGPISVNPDTGLPEAFAWKDVLTTALIGLAGAYTGGVGSALAGGGTMGALTGTALGAGTGALAGGSLSAAQGRGFGAGALGGAISGGMGGFGGSNLPGAGPVENVAVAPTTTNSLTSAADSLKSNANSLQTPFMPEGYAKVNTPFMDAQNPLPAVPTINNTQFNAKDYALNFKPETELQNTATGAPLSSKLSTATGNQLSAMGNKDNMYEYGKTVGVGSLLGVGAQDMVEQNQAMATQMRQEKLAAQANEQQQQDYFKDLGYPLAPLSTLNNPNTQSQFDYYKDIINPRGAAVGGSMNVQVPIGGTPVSFTIPPNYGSMLEKLDIPSEQNDIKNELGLATGGYVNTQPVNSNNTYPQSQIPSAQPYAASTPQRHEVLDYYKDGGFLDGPGDGMSDDIAANIDGEEEIRLADGEFVVPPDLVRMLGFGDPEEGAKLLDKLLPIVRQAAHGKKEQIKQDAGKLAAEKMLARAMQNNA